MNMRYDQKSTWLDDVEHALEAYRDNVVRNLRKEAFDLDIATLENRTLETLLPELEEKNRNARHFIRRCRSKHVWMPALIQGPDERLEDIALNPHSLDAYHRYEKTLQTEGYAKCQYHGYHPLYDTKLYILLTVWEQ